MSIDIPVLVLPHGEDLPLPSYATAGAAGLDLIAAVAEGEPLVLPPLGRAAVPTGLCLAVPAGFEAQVRPRSGLALKNGVTVLNAPGTVDSDYRGEVKVLLVNLGGADFTVTRGMRIAQMVVAPVTHATLEISRDLEKTTRGNGGFGSTGLDGGQISR